MRPAWYPDWSDRPAVVVAAGPSAAEADLRPARGRAGVIAVNESWRLAPWADVLYSCDPGWWAHRRGVPEFGGLKVTQDKGAAEHFGLLHVPLGNGGGLIETRPGWLGWGGNSGFQAINLALQFGAPRIVMVGFDMRSAGSVHWHGRHGGGLNNPSDLLLAKWARTLDEAAPEFAHLGVEIINATPGSALQAYKAGTIEEAL